MAALAAALAAAALAALVAALAAALSSALAAALASASETALGAAWTAALEAALAAASATAASDVTFAYLTVEFEPLMAVWGAVWYPRYLVSLHVSMPHFEMHFELFPLFLLLLVSFAFEHL